MEGRARGKGGGSQRRRRGRGRRGGVGSTTRRCGVAGGVAGRQEGSRGEAKGRREGAARPRGGARRGRRCDARDPFAAGQHRDRVHKGLGRAQHLEYTAAQLPQPHGAVVGAREEADAGHGGERTHDVVMTGVGALALAAQPELHPARAHRPHPHGGRIARMRSHQDDTSATR